MRTIGNLIWFVFGGVMMGLAWWLAGLVMLLTIVGIPWAKASFVIGQFSFFPFGKEAISRRELHQQDDVGTGALRWSLDLWGNAYRVDRANAELSDTMERSHEAHRGIELEVTDAYEQARAAHAE